MSNLNLDPIKARIAAIEDTFGRNWKIVTDDDGSDPGEQDEPFEEYMVVTEDSGDPYKFGEIFTPILTTSQADGGLHEFLRTGLDVQRNLIAEVERLKAELEGAELIAKALAASRYALDHAQRVCPYHGATPPPAGMFAGCDSCEQPTRVRNAIAAIEAVLVKGGEPE